MQYGIPTMKLSKEVVQRRIKLLEDEGVVFHTNVNIGKDYLAKVFRTKLFNVKKKILIYSYISGALRSV